MELWLPALSMVMCVFVLQTLVWFMFLPDR